MTFDFNSKTSRRAVLGGGVAAAGAAAVGGALALPGLAQAANAPAIKLLNVSYDPTRELYVAINAAFANYWKNRTGQTVTIQQSHGGSGSQARSVIDGVQADVVTLALAADIDAIAKEAKLLPVDWQSKLPNNSTPYTSTIVFLVRKGNPWKIRDWSDLIKTGVKVITPNPKTSGGARWAYLAAWGYAARLPGGTDAKAKDFVAKLYANVPVLGSGARASTLTFAQQGIGDVLLSWENEAHLAIKEFGDKFDIVFPPTSILAEPPVALVEKNAARKKTTTVATGYLNFLYSPLAQEIVAQNYYRPRDAAAAAKYASNFPKISLFDIDDQFGGWTKAQKTHFSDGGVFDSIYSPR